MGFNKAILKNRFPLIIVLFFVVRTLNLTSIPIFNDEAIYLDWGFRETHTPGYLYYSLYDNKQPLLMWLFGVSQSIFSDPLFAGRLISVICGVCTLIGIYSITKEFFDKKVAYLASILYVFVPIFVFFDREALMESAIGAVGIWSCYFWAKYIKTGHRKFMGWLGVILGVGFFIKSSLVIYVFTLLLLVAWLKFRKKTDLNLSKDLPTVFIVMFAVDILLVINPMFWATLGKNSNYSNSIIEILKFPISTWFNNSYSVLRINFLEVTPIVFILSIFGLIKSLKEKELIKATISWWFLVSILLLIVLAKNLQERYLVSFLPLIVVFASYKTMDFLDKNQIKQVLIKLVLLIIPVVLTFCLIFRPEMYFIEGSKLGLTIDSSYYSSGYLIPSVIDYINKLSNGKNVSIGIAENIGNPESAINTYYEKSPNVTVVYFDSKILGDSITGADCITVPGEMYFVSRDQQQAGLNKYLYPIKTFKSPYEHFLIGIYTLKRNCAGRTVNLNIGKM